jgi:hypothetical protein
VRVLDAPSDLAGFGSGYGLSLGFKGLVGFWVNHHIKSRITKLFVIQNKAVFGVFTQISQLLGPQASFENSCTSLQTAMPALFAHPGQAREGVAAPCESTDEQVSRRDG